MFNVRSKPTPKVQRRNFGTSSLYLHYQFLFTDGKEYFCEKHDIYNQSCNISFSSLNQMQLNVPEPVEPRESVNTFPDSDEEYPTENNLNQTDFSHTKPIVIESEHVKYDKFNEADSANHSFDDGIDVVDGLIKTNVNSCDYDKSENGPKKHGNSVDSGISNNINGANVDKSENCNGKDIDLEVKKTLPSRLSDLSLKGTDNGLNTSSDDDKYESDVDISPRLKNGNGLTNGMDKKNGVSLNLRLQSEMRYVF